MKKKKEPGRTVRSFFNIEADVLRRRFETIQKLLPSQFHSGAAHAGEEGRHIESILRDFLNRHLPSGLRAFSGFILRPATKIGTDDLRRLEGGDGDQHSRQLDVIIYDHARYPIYERFEEFVVVPPEGVVGIISVKKTLYRAQLRGELDSLVQAAELCDKQARGPHLGLFAFQPGNAWTNERWAQEIIAETKAVMGGKPFNHLINEVSVLNRFVIFKFAPSDKTSNNAKFVRCDVAESAQYLPLARMLQSIFSVFYDRDGGSPRPGFVHFEEGAFGRAPEAGQVPYAK